MSRQCCWLHVWCWEGDLCVGGRQELSHPYPLRDKDRGPHTTTLPQLLPQEKAHELRNEKGPRTSCDCPPCLAPSRHCKYLLSGWGAVYELRDWAGDFTTLSPKSLVLVKTVIPAWLPGFFESEKDAPVAYRVYSVC